MEEEGNAYPPYPTNNLILENCSRAFEEAVGETTRPALNTEELNSKYQAINSALLEAASKHLEKRERVYREYRQSENIKRLFKERDNFNREGKYTLAYQRTKEIRQRIKEETAEQTINELKKSYVRILKTLERVSNPTTQR